MLFFHPFHSTSLGLLHHCHLFFYFYLFHIYLSCILSFTESLQMSPSTHFAKLTFRHGPVSSAKTMNLLAVAYNYRVQGKTVALLKVRNSLIPFLFF